MMPVIRISEDHFEVLKTWAEPLVDSSDDALGKALKAAELYRESMSAQREESQDPAVVQSQNKKKELKTDLDSGGAQKNRLPRGLQVPDRAYERPIVEAVYELGGSGPVADVLAIVEQKMKHLLTDVDYEVLSSGREVRWRSSAKWARNSLVHKQGLLRKDSPRGVWELTDKGVAMVEDWRK